MSALKFSDMVMKARTAISPGGSINTSAATGYLSVPNNGDFALGTADFTIEWFQLLKNPTQFVRVFSIGAYPTASLAVSVEGGTLYFWAASGYRSNYVVKTPYVNKWTHFAISRAGGVLRIFQDGNMVSFKGADSTDITDNTTPMYVGGEGAGAGEPTTRFIGLITNLRIVKGTALYTSTYPAFTVPTSPLSDVTNCVLLLKASTSGTLLTDSSSVGKTITQNNATWSAGSPF
jgi:hypothetical protein